MRTFWLGLAAVAMTAAVWASDAAPDVQVGDWVKSRMEMSSPDRPDMPMTVVTRVASVKDGMAALAVTTTVSLPGMDEPYTFSSESEASIAKLGSPTGLLDLPEGTKAEVLEKGERTIEVGGETFEDLLWQKVKVTQAAKGNEPAMDATVEVWEDGEAPFPMARMVKVVLKGTSTTPDGETVDVQMVMERLDYGRAGDPIDDEGEDDGE